LAELKRKKNGKIVWKPKPYESGVYLTGVRDDDSLRELINKLINFILLDLTIRFRDCKTITAFKIFDPTVYASSMSTLKLLAFGVSEYETLCAHFCGPDKLFVCDEAELQQEFTRMKRFMYDFLSRGRNRDLEFHDVWKRLATANGHLFPHMIMLVQVMCVIPTHTCDVERGFSMHRLIKHRLTSRLRVVTVDSMMRVKLNSRDGIDGIQISSVNSAADNLDEVVTPLIKKYFHAVNDLELVDQIVHEVSDAEYDEDGEIRDEDELDDVTYVDLDEE